ncbi:GDT1-like protein 3 [Brassica napus]|uniref:GDT1-like protein 3 n=1 Tax=Brassica napus TaxID=3708 RepID=UPI0006AB04AD|nr:GDT1-like protein 3 [Brassica napus]
MSASSSFPPSLRRNLGLTRNRKDLVIKELGCRGMIGTERIGLDAGDSLGALGLNLESTGPGVFDALFSSFSMILVTEIGDDTFIIAALMAMRHPKATVLSGALSALFVMTY